MATKASSTSRKTSGFASRALMAALVVTGGLMTADIAAARESRGSSTGGGAHMPRGQHGTQIRQHHRGPRWGSRINSRWYAGFYAPGGWGGYTRPYYGYTLPSYWTNQAYYLPSYATYGLPAPQAGHGWSRYYDDAVLTDGYGRVIDHRSDIRWDRYEGGYYDRDEADDPRLPGYDQSVYIQGDHVRQGGHTAPVTRSGEYTGSWNGNYATPDGGVYDGSYSGTYTDENGGVMDVDYQGRWVGRGRAVDQDGRVYYQGWTPDEQAHWGGHEGRGSAYERAERMERCRRDNGLGGAAIGTVVGGVLGNRIAGRGNRTGGTIAGGVVGAIAGAAIDKAERDDCDDYGYPEGGHGGQYSQGYPGYGYGYGGGYYYPQPTVTTVVVQPQTVTTTTVTEETYYEPVRTTARRHVPRRRTPVRRTPQPRCTCR